MKTKYIFSNIQKTIVSVAALSSFAVSVQAQTNTWAHSGGLFNNIETVNGIEMQTAHQYIDTIFVKDNETKHLNFQVKSDNQKVGNSRRWFRYDTNEALSTTTFHDGNTTVTANLDKDGLYYQNSAGIAYGVISNLTSPNMALAVDLFNGASTATQSTTGSGTSAIITYTEPTVGYRMVYYIRPAKDIAAFLDKCTGSITSGTLSTSTKFLENYDMTAPAGKNLLIGPQKCYASASIDGLQFEPNYYYTKSGVLTATNATDFTWYKSSDGGAYSAYTITPNNGKLISVTAPAAGKYDTYILTNGSVFIAKFTINAQSVTNTASSYGVGPVEETGGVAIATETTLSSKYKKIADLNFDSFGLLDKTAADKGATTTLLKPDESSYSFKSGASGANWSNYAFTTNSTVISTGRWCAQNVYDRTYATSTTGKKGYFMYVDAAETQGAVAKLNISEACCPGTKVFISSWIVDINKSNGSYAPNMNFEIVAIDENDKKNTLKIFTTGDLTTINAHTSAWKQVFFALEVPRNTTYKSMYLYIRNNQLSSAGDDFGVDDIEAYMERPAVEAEQTAYLCSQSATIRTHINYTKMLKLTGMDNLTTPNSIHVGYCFIDSVVYYGELNSGKTTDVAFHDARIKLGNSVVSDTYYSEFVLNSDYSVYTATADMTNSPYARKETYASSTDKYLYFDAEISDQNLLPGRTYFAVFNIQGTGIKDSTRYSISNKCDAFTSFVLKGTSIIMVDGTTDLYAEGADFCYRQSPTFNVAKLSYKDAQGNVQWLDVAKNNISFDWYVGPLADYKKQQYGSGSNISISDALGIFRKAYPTGDDANVAVTSVYTQEYKDILLPLISKGTLILQKETYSPELPSAGTYYFQAIPVPGTVTTSAAICTDAQTIVFNAYDKAPLMYYGLPGVDYGDVNSHHVVPLRVSLAQIRACNTTTNKHITVPVRTVSTVTDKSTQLAVSPHTHRDSIYVTESTDPAFKNLARNFTGIGFTRLIDADNTKPNTTTQLNNYFQILFDDKYAAMFKEGYTYKLEMYYAELKYASSTEYTNACDGNIYLLLKVVPAYENWIGGDSNQDWNNDANWQRADGGEFYASSSYVNNTTNTTSNGFVPLKYTNIIIAKGTTANDVPLLVKHDVVSATNLVLNAGANATPDIAYDMVIKDDGTNYGCTTYYENTCKDVYLKPEAEIMNAQLLTYEKAHVDYELTKNRWYLLSSPLKAVVAGDMYAPKDNARQETDAFADITFDNTLTKNNRFNPAVYQRSWDKNSSMVYEYVDGTSTGDTQRNVFIKANWSNVYNDVDVTYAPGTGFSLKPVVSTAFTGDKTLFRLPKADTQYYYFTNGGKSGQYKTIDRTENSVDVSGKLFTDYLKTADTKEVTVTNSSAINQLFLVGNPFPCQMDMAQFFDTNTQLDKKYWILSGSHQDAVIFSADGELVSTVAGTTVSPMQGFFVKNSTAAGSTIITFSKAMMTGQSAGISSPGLKAKRQTSPITSKLYLTADNNSIILVRNADASNDFSDKEDVETIEDNNLGKVPVLYSIAGNKAVQINQFNNSTVIPVGILNGADTTVTVKISGSAAENGEVSLYDAVSKSTVNIISDTIVTMTSAQAGRYFIMYNQQTTDISGTSGENISILTTAGTVQITSGLADPLNSIQIADMGGKVYVAERDIHSADEIFRLPAGIYIVRARNNSSCKTEKVIVR